MGELEWEHGVRGAPHRDGRHLQLAQGGLECRELLRLARLSEALELARRVERGLMRLHDAADLLVRQSLRPLIGSRERALPRGSEVVVAGLQRGRELTL